MTDFPRVLTARQLAESVLPKSEDEIKALARKHGIGRLWGRAYIFTPADVHALIASLPCPSSSPDATEAHTGTYAGPSAASASMKVQAFPEKKLRKP